MANSTLLQNLCLMSAFGGILIGFVILIKNNRKRTNWPIAFLMILLGLILFLSSGSEQGQGWKMYLILFTTILVPLFANPYLNSFFRGDAGVSVKHMLLNFYLLVLLTLGLVMPSVNVVIPIAIGLVSGVLGIIVLQKRLAKKFKSKSTRKAWLQVIMILLVSFYINAAFAITNPRLMTDILQAGLSLFLLSMVIALVLMPDYLYEAALVNLTVPLESAPKTQINKARSTSSLSVETKREYIERITSYMEDEEPYLNKGFTLNSLAQSLELSPTYTSRVINDVYGKNFRDFVNTYRIKKACEFLSEEKMKTYTIEAVATEAGFHSRTAFYNAFKKIMKVSPGEYMNCCQNELEALELPAVKVRYA